MEGNGDALTGVNDAGRIMDGARIEPVLAIPADFDRRGGSFGTFEAGVGSLPADASDSTTGGNSGKGADSFVATAGIAKSAVGSPLDDACTTSGSFTGSEGLSADDSSTGLTLNFPSAGWVTTTSAITSIAGDAAAALSASPLVSTTQCIALLINPARSFRIWS
jgi:hypothetical protein